MRSTELDGADGAFGMNSKDLSEDFDDGDWNENELMKVSLTGSFGDPSGWECDESWWDWGGLRC